MSKEHSNLICVGPSQADQGSLCPTLSLLECSETCESCPNKRTFTDSDALGFIDTLMLKDFSLGSGSLGSKCFFLYLATYRHAITNWYLMCKEISDELKHELVCWKHKAKESRGRNSPY